MRRYRIALIPLYVSPVVARERGREYIQTVVHACVVFAVGEHEGIGRTLGKTLAATATKCVRLEVIASTIPLARRPVGVLR